MTPPCREPQFSEAAEIDSKGELHGAKSANNLTVVKAAHTTSSTADGHVPKKQAVDPEPIRCVCGAMRRRGVSWLVWRSCGSGLGTVPDTRVEWWWWGAGVVMVIVPQLSAGCGRIMRIRKVMATSRRRGCLTSSKAARGCGRGSSLDDAWRRYIIMEMTPVTSIDSTALHMLEDLHRDLKERGIRLGLATVGSRVEATFQMAGLTKKMGAHWIFPSVRAATPLPRAHRAAATTC